MRIDAAEPDSGKNTREDGRGAGSSTAAGGAALILTTASTSRLLWFSFSSSWPAWTAQQRAQGCSPSKVLSKAAERPCCYEFAANMPIHATIWMANQ